MSFGEVHQDWELKTQAAKHIEFERGAPSSTSALSSQFEWRMMKAPGAQSPAPVRLGCFVSAIMEQVHALGTTK
jgi:hypothetical protein